MATEDFTTYTEVDPLSKITVTAARATFVDLSGNPDSYLYKDKGASFFDGNFQYSFTLKLDGFADGGTGIWWAMTNILDDLTGIDSASGDYLALGILRTAANNCRYNLYECDGGTLYSVQGFLRTISTETGTTRSIVITRDESVGTYGTIALSVGGGDLISIALHSSKKDFRYIHAVQSLGGSGKGYTQSLILSELPTVTTQAVTDISGTTATGNGNITSLGYPNPTAHGVCWNTTGTPTTADSSTNEGAASATGAFTTSMTGLVTGTLYYVRAYATNTQGTSYGGEVTFQDASVYPTEAITRVTSITHRYSEGNYTMELSLGEVVADFGLPMISLKPQPALPPPPDVLAVNAAQNWSEWGQGAGTMPKIPVPISTYPYTCPFDGQGFNDWWSYYWHLLLNHKTTPSGS